MWITKKSACVRGCQTVNGKLIKEKSLRDRPEKYFWHIPYMIKIKRYFLTIILFHCEKIFAVDKGLFLCQGCLKK